MRISNEIDRINYLPSSRFFDYLQDAFQGEVSWHASGDDHDEPLPDVEDVRHALEEARYDPLEDPEDDDIAKWWADLAYPLPEDAEDILVACGDANDIARASLRDYVNMFDLDALIEEHLHDLQVMRIEEEMDI